MRIEGKIEMCGSMGLVFLILLMSIRLYGQSKEVLYCNSLLEKNELSEQDFEDLDKALFNINYYKSDNPKELYKKAKMRAIEHKLPKYVGIYDFKLADMYYELSDLDSANYFAERAAELFQKTGDELNYARTANIRRLILTSRNDFVGAYKLCFEALEVFEKYQDKQGLAITNRDIGSIMVHEKKYEQALEYCLKGIDDLIENENWYELTFSYQRMGIIYKNLGEFERAHQFIDKSIEACLQLTGFRLSQNLAKQYWTHGYIFEEEGKYDEALEYYNLTRLEAEKINFYLAKRSLFNSVGSIYLKQQKYQEAIDQFNKSLDFSTKGHIAQNAYDYYTPVYINLVKAYEGLGEYEKANEYLRKFSSAKDSIFAFESERLRKELQTKYETVQKETQISLLQSDKTTQRRLLILGSILMGCLGLVVFLLWRINRFRARVNEKLLLQKQLITEKSEENELLLKEIHHRIKNNLQILSSLLSLQSNCIQNEQAADALKEGRNRVESMGLIHQKLYTEDHKTAIKLKDYIQDLSAYLSDSFLLANQNIKITNDVEVSLVDVETAIPLGLVINELITNSVKYAFTDRTGGKIHIRIWLKTKDKLCLQVSDNGNGGIPVIDKARSTNFGTDLIKVLIKKLKGRLEISNDNGYVTFIEFDRFKVYSDEVVDLELIS